MGRYIKKHYNSDGARVNNNIITVGKLNIIFCFSQ